MSITSTEQRSFLKWVGGKTRVAGLLAGLAPERFERYVEPFLGSAAVFFATGARKALLADLNEELVICFRQVRDNADEVMRLLDVMPNTQEHFLAVRSRSPASMSDLERAARVIYLNKTGFRGLWRVNRKGEFNVPYGAYDRPLYNRETVRSAASRLAGVHIEHQGFEATLETATVGDWVYLDPPYVPSGGYSDFKRYTSGQFREDDHDRLSACCRDLDRAGVKFVLTNTNNDEARALYKGFGAWVLPTRRDVNLNTRMRQSTDLVVANYDVGPRLQQLLGSQDELPIAV